MNNHKKKHIHNKYTAFINLFNTRYFYNTQYLSIHLVHYIMLFYTSIQTIFIFLFYQQNNNYLNHKFNILNDGQCQCYHLRFVIFL